MIILDAALFIIIIGALNYYKLRSPNFLFFCKGAVLFLPPDQQQQQQSGKKDIKNINKDKKPHHQISVLQVQYNHVKTYPFCSDYDRVMLTLTGLVIFMLMRLPLNLLNGDGQNSDNQLLPFLLPQISLLPFYLIAAITIYAVKIAVDVFMVSAYKSSTCFLIAFTLNALYFFLAVLLSHIQGIYDPTLQRQITDYSKYLELVLGNNYVGFINMYTVMGAVVFANFFITLAAIPTVVKFGNWYTKTLKEVHYQQDPQENQAKRLLNSSMESSKQAQQNVKNNARKTVRLLNYYMVGSLVFIVLSHRMVTQLVLDYVPEIVVDGVRVLVMVVSIGLIICTSKEAMEFNGAFAYKYVMEYFREKDKALKDQLRRQIVPYIYHIWYHLYQFLTRIIILAFLLLMVLYWKYGVQNRGEADGRNLGTDSNSIKQTFLKYNPDIECQINTMQFLDFENLYRCPIKTSKQMEQQNRLATYHIMSGTVKGLPTYLTPAQLQEHVLKYGILKRSFMYEFSQLLLWYASITIYLMTTAYIVFVRKTVYDL